MFTPASGSTFPIATTTVNASATDQAGNVAAGSFTVTVTPLSPTQSWRYQYFTTVSNTRNAADAADPDGDGIVNALEFATHSIPTAHNVAPGALVVNGSNLEFTYIRAKAAMNAGFTFDVEWSDDLVPLSWSTAGVSEMILNEDADVQQVKATVPAGSNGRRFVRLEVTP